MKQENPYQEVISIIADGFINYRGISLALAKQHPKIFVKLAKSLKDKKAFGFDDSKYEKYIRAIGFDYSAYEKKLAEEVGSQKPSYDSIHHGAPIIDTSAIWYMACGANWRADRKVEAIKEFRKNTGMTLVQAKNYCEEHFK